MNVSKSTSILTRAGYIFNSGFAGIEEADALLIVGSNPRIEAPVVDARIRKRWLRGAFPVCVIGEQADLTYEYDYLGAGPQTLSEIASGKHPFAKVLKTAKQPMVIVGMGALARTDGSAVLATVRKVAEDTGVAGKEPGVGMVGAGLVEAPMACFADAVRALAAATEGRAGRPAPGAVRP